MFPSKPAKEIKKADAIQPAQKGMYPTAHFNRACIIHTIANESRCEQNTKQISEKRASHEGCGNSD